MNAALSRYSFLSSDLSVALPLVSEKREKIAILAAAELELSLFEAC